LVEKWLIPGMGLGTFCAKRTYPKNDGDTSKAHRSQSEGA